MKLSVIITAYNAENYIKQCLDSVISQNVPCEIVVVNDASTDSTRKILEEYKDQAVIINLEKNNGSVAKTRNVGLEHSTGDYITYLDADDFYESNALEKVADCIDKSNADILKFGYTLLFSDGRKKLPKTSVTETELVRKEEFKKKVYPKFIDGIELNSVCLAVFKRSILENVRFSESFVTAEDVAFTIEAYTNAKTVMFLNEPLYVYRRLGTGLTGSAVGIAKKYKYNFLISKKILNFLKLWDMDTPSLRLRTILRPIKLTAGKILRGKA